MHLVFLLCKCHHSDTDLRCTDLLGMAMSQRKRITSLKTLMATGSLLPLLMKLISQKMNVLLTDVTRKAFFVSSSG